MTFRTLGTLILLLACGLATTSCMKHAPSPAAVTPEALIDEIVQLSGTSATRLHPDYVWRSLHTMEEDGSVRAAFDAALANGSHDAKLALLRALELQFVHDPNTSALDLLGGELSEHFRTFDWQPADYPGGTKGPNETFADVMVDALDVVSPERRANRSRTAVILRKEATEDIWQYMESEWVTVPGQEEWMLNRHARESFIRMRDQARAEGVELVILSAHRLRKTAEANAARTKNPAAVASFSAHSLGLAIDFRMSQGELKFSEVTTRPMAEVVRMRESPVHKWLHLRGAEFGWFPYQNEPWHWEYNPPGFRDVYFSNFPGGAPQRDWDASEGT
ncbi:MAG: hypothetical protein PWP23_740 [Candidatus Sumerlaeota bacterium]|nr:hypothetical protein [Candidatus Sumerlaeota bacterium]